MPASAEAAFVVDASVYPLAAVQAAAYSFTGRSFVRLFRSGRDIRVVIRPKGAGDAVVLKKEFFNELLHQSIRLRVSRGGARIREYVVTRALVSALPAGEPACPECAVEARRPLRRRARAR